MTASMAAFEYFVRTGEMPQPPVTYEAGINEPVHPDFSIVMRMEEVAISGCTSGCKIYADPDSRLRVLAHNRVYGCTVTREELSR